MLLLSAKKHPNAGSIQSKMIWAQNSKLLDSVGLEYSINGLAFNRGAYESVEKYDNEEEIFGCCAGASLYRSDALKDIEFEGMFFDEDFFAYYEDFDIALRLRWVGWSSWYCPKATVLHYKGGTEKPISDFTIYHNWRNSTWTIAKNLPRNFIIINLPLIILSELLQILINLIRKKPIIFISKFDSYKKLRKFRTKYQKIPKNIQFKDLKKWFILRWR